MSNSSLPKHVAVRILVYTLSNGKEYFTEQVNWPPVNYPIPQVGMFIVFVVINAILGVVILVSHCSCDNLVRHWNNRICCLQDISVIQFTYFIYQTVKFCVVYKEIKGLEPFEMLREPSLFPLCGTRKREGDLQVHTTFQTALLLHSAFRSVPNCRASAARRRGGTRTWPSRSSTSRRAVERSIFVKYYANVTHFINLRPSLSAWGGM